MTLALTFRILAFVVWMSILFQVVFNSVADDNFFFYFMAGPFVYISVNRCDFISKETKDFREEQMSDLGICQVDSQLFIFV